MDSVLIRRRNVYAIQWPWVFGELAWCIWGQTPRICAVFVQYITDQYSLCLFIDKF